MPAATEKLENTWPNHALTGDGPFFRSATHEEALARAHFLVDNRKQIGLLIGESGSGRSMLLVALADELQRNGRQVARVHLYGLSADELLWALAAELGLNPAADASTGRLWRDITDRLAAARFEQQQVVILLDDVDRAQPDALAALLRIAKCDPAAVGQQTLVLGCHADRVKTLGTALLDLATLRIDLGRWSVEEIGQYMAEYSASDTSASIAIGPDAAARLHEVSHGVPRRVGQLFSLAIVAATAQGTDQVDRKLIDAVDGQLAVS